MSFNKTVVALAIILAATILGGNTTFAAKQQSTPKADAVKSEPKAQDVPVTATVNEGDTLSSIADTYHTTWVRIFNANESIANPDLINAGEKFRIPKDDEQLADRYAALVTAVVQSAPAAASTAAITVAPTATTTTTGRVSSASVGNSYVWGNCTWYVYNQKPNIGSFWGNANQWISSAQADGFATGSTPVAGAIGASGNHVVYVESVNGDMVTISEMNYAGGVGVVHYRTVSANSFFYIYA